MSDEEQQRGNPPQWFRVVYRYYYLGHLLVLGLIARTISLRSGDVMTSPCCVYAGSEAVLPFNGIGNAIIRLLGLVGQGSILVRSRAPYMKRRTSITSSNTT